ncbi:MAG: DNA repair protein RecO [Deltaproteobacteria bacterium]|nr:DNA repair protein RecO [Deltaproteobacteria bacterium]
MRSFSKVNTSKAIVLSVTSFGESDRYIQFLTQQWGVITVLAKAARKSKRRYVGGLDLFCHDEIFIKGDPKERPYLNELVVLNCFAGIRESLGKLLTAGKWIQWTKKFANYPTPMPGIYSLLGQSLALLEKNSEQHSERLDLLFRIKFLTQLGLQPQSRLCVQCTVELNADCYFDLPAGGLFCEQCALLNHLKTAKLKSWEQKALSIAEQIRLTQWHVLNIFEENLSNLINLLTQFASYHTHVRLPL